MPFGAGFPEKRTVAPGLASAIVHSKKKRPEWPLFLKLLFSSGCLAATRCKADESDADRKQQAGSRDRNRRDVHRIDETA